MHQFLHDLHVVIHTFEQNRLTPQWDAGIRHSVTGQLDFRRDFSGMIEMQVGVQRMELL